ncbi:MAG: LPS export ABC transporter periplasmic protein LptC [Candidatus Hydrogenedentes bacterium]|nr:LPS export ABC transporter periplasmic protein LptC [Candidatus Hydrogenedentota bacterium]
MKRSLVVIAVIAAAIAGCTKPAATPSQPAPAPTQQPGTQPATPAPAQPETVPTASAPSDQVTMTGNLTFKLFETSVEGEQQKPTFEVTSPQGSLLEDNVWALKNASAVVFGKNGEETRFEAGSARFDNVNKTAELSEGVVITMGTRRIELQDVTWNNDKREAVSENEATVTDGDTQLKSKGMEFHAETQQLLLRNVVGKVSMQGGATQ